MKDEITPLEQFITNDNNAPAYWMLDILWVIKVSGAQTGNAFSLIEQTMPYGSGPPPHLHPDMEEMFYVIDGEITIWIDGKISRLSPGTSALMPRNTVHYFKSKLLPICPLRNITN